MNSKKKKSYRTIFCGIFYDAVKINLKKDLLHHYCNFDKTFYKKPK